MPPARPTTNLGEAELVQLADFLPQMVWMSTPDGNNIYFNQRWTDYTGLTLEESYGAGWNTPFHPDDQAIAREAWNRAVQTGKEYRVESRLRAADGSYRWFLMRGQLCHEHNGQILKWLGTCTDIHDQKLAEQKARDGEERFQLAMEVVKLALAEIDYETGLNHLSAEAAAVFGLGAEALAVPRSAVHATFHPEDREEIALRIQECLDPAGTGWFAMDHRVVLPNGETRWLRVRKQVYFAGSPHARAPHHAMLAAFDVTAEREALELAQRSEQRLTLAQNAGCLAIWDWDLATDRFTWTGDTLSVWGRTADTMGLGETLFSYLHPDDRQATREALDKNLKGAGEYYHEFRVLWPDESIHWILGRGNKIQRPGQVPTRMLGVYTEITARKQAEESLRDEQTKLRVALRSVPLVLYTSDRDNRVTWIHGNQTYKVEELIGKTDEDLEPSGALAELTEFKRSVMDRNVADHREMRLVVKGVPMVYDITAEPIHNAEGTVTGITVASLNVTERALVTEELREKSELIDLAQTAVNAGYWSYFPESGRCFLSPGEQVLFGLQDNPRPSVADVIQRVHEADREQVLHRLTEGIQSGAYFSEFRIQNEGGAMRWVAGQGRVLTRANGERYMVGINFDITNQKLSEEALRKSEKLAVVGRLAATISHEINNPLESVTNLLYILRTSAQDEATRQYAITAEEELSRVNQIVTHSLRFHRSSTAPSDEKLSALLDSAAGVYKSRLLADKIRVKRDYRDQNLVRCYSSELRQIFGNLISNAFDAIKNDGIICLRARDAVDLITRQSGVRVTIADSGYGMDPSTLQRLFEPFFTTKGVNGTGLGLWITRDLLNKHHAKVKVRSQCWPQTSGTVFSIFFPSNVIDLPPSSDSDRLA